MITNVPVYDNKGLFSRNEIVGVEERGYFKPYSEIWKMKDTVYAIDGAFRQLERTSPMRPVARTARVRSVCTKCNREWDRVIKQ